MDDHTQDFYAILGVAPSADAQDIKVSYRAAARRFHPDVNNNPGAAVQFQDIAAAYEILNDASKKRSYDNLRQRLAPESQYYSVRIIPSRRTIPILGEPQIMYALVQIIPNQDLYSKSARSAPLNLALVLDRSKSMSGARLDRVKAAAHEIIDQLSENDYLSIVSFSDRADSIISSERVVDKTAMKSLVSTMSVDGGTEIFQGLSQGQEEVLRHYDSDYVNHIILLTDGETYDDEDLSLELAEEAVNKGIGISTMGIGDEWNDVFLDKIASRTGGSSAYINSPNAVVSFLNERVRSLGAAFAERMSVSIAPDPDVKLDSIFKLMPNPQPLEGSYQPVQLGTLENSRPTTLLVQLQMPADLKVGFRSMLRLDVTGDLLQQKRPGYKVITDLSTEIGESPPPEDPPRAILDALGKLTLYRMQQKAETSIQEGRFDEATRRLSNLATRLLAAGHDELARTALQEAQRVQNTKMLSEEGRKTIKFGTRMLLDDVMDEGHTLP